MACLKKISLLFSFTIFFIRGYSQTFGGEPSSVKWKQINTTDSRVIFPTGLDSVATRITNIISYIKDSTERTIGERTKKINPGDIGAIMNASKSLRESNLFITPYS